MRALDKKATSDGGKSKISNTTTVKDRVAKNAEKASATTSVGRNKESARISRGKNDIVNTITKGAYARGK